ncbi:hypothetical protein [Nocardia mexicana]|uniref:Uncharacterized protein n=1 Tax=Nocardia mexicana TaxID=279262 RepID=A0A370GPY6_9NOCA|nr:hypothetical protein [Nocardia mexicana]RDI45316.1 hypothetical protein DFR68_11386 [Nocardia mexicana]
MTGSHRCACGCGRATGRDYLPLHDHRAVQDLVRRMFGGSTGRLIAYVERMAAEHGIPDSVTGDLRPIRPPLADAVCDLDHG